MHLPFQGRIAVLRSKAASLFAQTIALALLVLSPLGVDAAVSVGDLRCESRKDPLGIDLAQPRLSWVLLSHERGVQQTAFQVLAASSEAKLKPGQADLWDSGRKETDQSIHVRYAGKPLASHMECFWVVRVWDQGGKPSDWSQPAKWSMGLLNPADWTGKWIGLDGEETKERLTGTQWIWFPEGQPERDAPLGARFFRRVFVLKDARGMKRAQMFVAADNQSTVFVNGQQVGTANNFKAAAVFDVSRRLRAGENVLAVRVQNVGAGPNPAGLTALLKVEYSMVEPFLLRTDQEWLASTNEAAGWEGLWFNDARWPAAKVLGSAGMDPWKEIVLPEERRLPARWLRKEFTTDKKVRRATAYLSGLGLSELYLNGEKVGDHVLSPGLTEYPKRVLYVTHDVTGLVKRGRNALGVVLGSGRYFAPRTDEPTFTQTYGFPKLLLQLRLDFEDGTSTEIVSDESWKLTTDGPIRANNEYDGEEYDARMEFEGWTDAGYGDAAWMSARGVSAPGGVLAAQMMEPIRVTGTLRPFSIAEPKEGVFIYDLGQNLVGWCRLKVRGKAGTQVSLRFAETLKPDGTLYLDNIRGAKVTDLYTLKGQGTEVFEPRFTYHGFRFVEVTGFPGRPTLSAMEGCVVNDDLESAGEFTCSHPMINRIYRNIHWGVRGNYRSIVTDCPQRDERQGWLGDRSSESKGETYLFRTVALHAKWIQDMADAQKPSGSVPDVCPSYWPLYSDNVTWPSSTVIIPGAMLDQYADLDLVARHYPSMVKWVDFMSGFIKNGIIRNDSYGDWCVPPEDPKLIHSKDPLRKTTNAVLATSYLCHDLRLMARYATLLRKPEDAQRFTKLADQLKTALNEQFISKERGYYDNGSQTSCVLPLAFDMVPADQRQRVFDHLVKKITEETKGHVGTGLIGGQWLNRVLSEGGRPDLVFQFATNTAYPSWGYMVEKGATTVWELWNGDTADPAMNSGNHVMLVGDLVIWLYENLAGIKPDPEKPGFKHILMRPTPVGDLKFVRATHRSPHGLIESAWQRDGATFEWTVTVPANTTATVHVPAKNADEVTEGGKRVGQARGLKFQRNEAGAAVFQLGSGTYQFKSRL